MLDAALRRLVHLLASLYVMAAMVYPLYMISCSLVKLSLLLKPPLREDVGSNLQPSRDVIHWPSKEGPPVALDEHLFLSKAFSHSMQPCKIIPYYYQASRSFEQDDITITTLVTISRFKVFAELAKRYRGPISAAVHVKPSASRVVLDALHDLYISTPEMALFVDVHLVLSPFDRQLNTWRNSARFFARTDFVMMLDVDFALCTDFRTDIRASLDSDVGHSIRSGHAAFIVPAFEYVKQQDGTDANEFPKDKKALLDLVKAKKIDMFHRSWFPGHNSSDYPYFYAAPPGEVYKVFKYQSAYEPYVIFRKDGPPWCDERFVGYGGNKAACLYEMYLSGVSFYVLADHFLVHQSHLYEEVARKLELRCFPNYVVQRKSNRKIYQEFKEETCLRYLQRNRDSGILNTILGQNVQDECKKIKGVSRTAVHIIESKM